MAGRHITYEVSPIYRIDKCCFQLQGVYQFAQLGTNKTEGALYVIHFLSVQNTVETSQQTHVGEWSSVYIHFGKEVIVRLPTETGEKGSRGGEIERKPSKATVE